MTALKMGKSVFSYLLHMLLMHRSTSSFNSSVKDKIVSEICGSPELKYKEEVVKGD